MTGNIAKMEENIAKLEEENKRLNEEMIISPDDDEIIMMLAGSLIKYIESKILMIAENETKSTMRLWRSEKKKLDYFWKMENNFLKALKLKMKSVKGLEKRQKEHLLKDIDSMFLKQISDSCNKQGFDLWNTFEHFKKLWDKRNMNFVHVFDKDIKKSKGDQSAQLNLQARLIRMVTESLPIIKHAQPKSPLECLKPFIPILNIAIEKKNVELGLN